MTPTPDAIRAAVAARKQEIVDLLLYVVGAESVTGNEAEVQHRFQEAYASRGLEVDAWESTAEEIAPYVVHVGEETRFRDRPNLVATRKGTGGGRSVMLQGHVDTVDAGDLSLWTKRHTGEATDDRVYGRGAGDMKAGVVSSIAALDVLADLGVRLQGDVLLAATTGEEDGGVGALSTILRGHRADAVVITEPTNLSLVIAHGGSLVFRITVNGKSAHGGFRNEGISAVEKFIPIFQDLLAWEAERNATLSHPLLDYLDNKFPISVGLVQAGTWASTVPETLIAEGRLGFLPGETIEEMMVQTEARVQKIAEADPWMREHPPVVEWIGGQFASAEVPRDEPIVLAMEWAHMAITGMAPVVRGVSWGSDMRLFTEIGKMPTLIYGAGDEHNIHCPDEYIDIEDILTAVQSLAMMLVDWCGVASSS
ncbi:MAG TPA: ArgE/DapE family deacylase [Thermomicrobiales bacterium]|nr:ArgE/DapE family deacylase [Thermomicrobiales bacterium]